ncbi:MAG TPA: protein-L-isoaspartate O-methyltransferase, partial [Geobacteraceae bacterium]
PYDRICVTAACPRIPQPLVEQLAPGGRLAAPVLTDEGQDLVLLEKGGDRVRSRVVCQVLYVHLRGRYGEGEA